MYRATEQRGQYIDRMNESMNSMADSAQKYLDSARQTVLKESAKASVKGFFK